MTVQTGPSEGLIQTLRKSDIKSQQPKPSSPMPLGLLNTLAKEEILDLFDVGHRGTGRQHYRGGVARLHQALRSVRTVLDGMDPRLAR